MNDSATTHTPGPWMVEPHADDFDGPINVVSEYSTVEGRKQANWIAECDLQDDRLDENRANARLIAAAPELLEALKAVAVLDDHIDLLAGNDGIAALVKDALAKAEGR